MLALGTLSGQYLETNADGSQSVLSKEETQLVQGALTIIYLCQNITFLQTNSFRISYSIAYVLINRYPRDKSSWIQQNLYPSLEGRRFASLE